MLVHGSDRFRMAGERVILQSRLPKGWKARRAKEGTHAEFPGTAVLWEDRYFEVIDADVIPSGGVRYVLEPWNDAHTIRVFMEYSADSEARLLADHQTARKQRRNSILGRLAGIVLGNLPVHAQERIANDLGLSPFRMTLLSLLPSLLLFGSCLYLTVDALLTKGGSAPPFWLTYIATLWLTESILRFFVAMSQNRGIGSILGSIVYVLLHPREAVRESVETFDPSSVEVPYDVDIQDRITMRAPLLTLLTIPEQNRLAQLYNFDYRKHAYFTAWTMLIGGLLGVISSWSALTYGFRVTQLLSLTLASIVLLEQLFRLPALKRGPAPSIFAFVVRPFARRLLEQR
ncbi:MAG TPA: hypothetical protein VF787_08810 [Thermoanaerobaculia bacterium]